jgi:hypothetical protein
MGTWIMGFKFCKKFTTGSQKWEPVSNQNQNWEPTFSDNWTQNQNPQKALHTISGSSLLKLKIQAFKLFFCPLSD